MRKMLIAILSVLLAAAVFAGCAKDGMVRPETAVVQETGEATTDGAGGEEPKTKSVPYAFDLTDIDGNVHRLSDYEGKPVYLKVWGSWCAPCVASLPHLDELAAEAKDFTVLSVVPKIAGEKDRDVLTEWFNGLGYENIVVLYDENATVVSDFDISAFPTQIFFDAEGVPVYGAMGVLDKSEIEDAMDRIINGEAG